MRNISSRKLNAGLVALAAFSGMFVTSCSSEGIVDAPEKVPVVLTATIDGRPITKSVSSTLQDEAFEVGESITVSIDDVAGTYHVGTDGILTGTSSVYISSSSDNPLCIGAWYPADAYQTWDDNPAFTVETDQSSDDNYKRSDLMGSYAEVTYASPKATLTFRHLLSKIVVSIEYCVEGVDRSSEVKVEILNVYPKAIPDSNYEENVISVLCDESMTYKADESAQRTSIIMKDPANNSSAKVAAIIPPQTISARRSFFRITVDGTEFIAYLDKSQNYTFEAGYEYLFTVKVDQTNVTAEAVKVNAWQAGNSTGEDLSNKTN